MKIWDNIKAWFGKILPVETEFQKNKLVFKTTQLHLAHIIKLKLEENDIPVLMINKRDTAYNNFGEIELYVRQGNVIRAKYIIEQSHE